MKSKFVKKLRSLRFLTGCMALFPFALNILCTELLSAICENAMNGERNYVFSRAIILIAFYIMIMLIPGTFECMYNNKRIIAFHDLRRYIYGIIIRKIGDNSFVYSTGNMKENLTDDLNNVIEKYAALQVRIACVVFVYTGYSVYLFINNPIIASTMIALSLIQIIPPFIVKKYLQQSYNDTREIESEMSDCILEGICGIDTIKSYGLYGWWSNRIELLNQKYKRVGKRSIYTSEMEKSMNTLVQNLLKYGLYIVLGTFAMYKWISMPDAVKAIAISGSFFPLIGDVSSGISRIITSNEAEKRLLSIDIPLDCSGMKIEEKTVELRNVRIEREGRVLFDMQGNTISMNGVCIMRGENGAGKTTLLNAIVGKYKDYSGEIRVGGIESRDLSDSNFPRQIAYVTQEDILLDFTAEELIDEELEGIREKDIIYSISKKFGIDLIAIKNKPLRELSGGERKKIFLSLVFAINSPIIVLDEPTNSLDKEGKEALADLINNVDSTVIVVSHEKGDFLPIGKELNLSIGGIDVG